MVAATIANVNRDPKKRAKAFEPTDFMPTNRRAAKQLPPTSAGLGAELRAMFRFKVKPK